VTVIFELSRGVSKFPQQRKKKLFRKLEIGWDRIAAIKLSLPTP
jgi:hypothetical protein